MTTTTPQKHHASPKTPPSTTTTTSDLDLNNNKDLEPLKDVGDVEKKVTIKKIVLVATLVFVMFMEGVDIGRINVLPCSWRRRRIFRGRNTIIRLGIKIFLKRGMGILECLGEGIEEVSGNSYVCW